MPEQMQGCEIKRTHTRINLRERKKSVPDIKNSEVMSIQSKFKVLLLK